MGDSSEDNSEKLQYLKADLLQQRNPAPKWKGNGYGVEDDDSHNLFMSEPSVSEADESSDHHMRLLSPLGSFTTEDEDGHGEADYLPPPPPPPARLLAPMAPSSPGNTSLSSWESPHLNQHRIHLHFSPGGDSLSHKAGSSVQSNQQQQQQQQQHFPYSQQRMPTYYSHLPQHLQHPDPYLASGLIPPSADAKTPERSYVQSSNSTSPASEGHLRRLDAFLDDLRVSSQGQVQVQETTTNMSFGSSTQKALDINGILRKQPNTNQHEPQLQARLSSMDTAVMENIGSSGEGEAKGTTDETVVMVLSDDSGDETKQTAEGSTHTQPLDWEEKASADDEKTTGRRSYRTAIRFSKSSGSSSGRGGGGGRSGTSASGRGHRRQRSGDAAAATLSTGSKEWRGMEQDRIPLPPAPGAHDDDDDDDYVHQIGNKPVNGSNRNKSRQVEATNKDDGKGNIESQAHGKGSKESQVSSGQTRVPAKQDAMNQFSTFALGTGMHEGPATQRRSFRVRQRRDSYRGRKSAPGLMLDSEDSSSLASGDPHVLHSSLPTSTFGGYMPSPDWSLPQTRQHVRKTSHPFSWSPLSSHHSGSTPSSGIDPNAAPQWQVPGAPMLRPYPPMRANSLDFAGRYHTDIEIPNRTYSVDAGAPGNDSRMRSAMNAWGHNSTGSIETSFSWLSGRNHDVSDSFFPSSEMSPLLGTGLKSYNGEKQSKNTVDDKIHPYEFEPDGLEKARRAVNFKPLLEGGKKVLESAPFSNVTRRFSKPDRRRFLPESGFDDDNEKYPTFVCPVCKTRQREFFTVTNAPKQFESASGYIAFYFGVYVIAALYIFGLQEGWGKLDCIYFAVITLTTAGLGDFVPTSDGAKVVCSIFIYFGVACIGLLLGSYIAGMLDESSFRAARANRIKSCPNCVRLQNIRDAAERRRKQFRRQKKEYQQNFTPSAEINGDGDPPGHSSKRMKREHRGTFQEQVQGFAFSERGMPCTPPLERNGNNFKKSASADLETSPTLGVHSPIPTVATLPDDSPSSRSVPLTQNSPRYTPPSPSTSQILHRQTHSRHESFVMQGGNLNLGLGGKTGIRRYSADLGVPATILEGTGTTMDIPPPPQSENDYNESSKGSTTESPDEEDNDGDDDESSCSSSESSSSESSESVDLEDEFNGVKNARYVFLTLREALINSLVIIGTGCFGFYFIEGFSFIDSWYFTTVLLTTVGYGDICPYTKGGKLFATIYILVAGTILLNNMSMISMIPLELRRRRTERAVLTQFGDALDDSALRELATGPLVRRLNLATENPGGLDECTREMFCLAMLVRLGKVTEEDIKLTFAAFKKLDLNDEKVLNSKAIIAGMIQRHRSNLNLAKMAESESQTISNRSTHSKASIGGSQPFYAWGSGFGTNIFVPTTTPTNEVVSSIGGTFDSSTPDNTSSAATTKSELTSTPFSFQPYEYAHRRNNSTHY